MVIAYTVNIKNDCRIASLTRHTVSTNDYPYGYPDCHSVGARINCLDVALPLYAIYSITSSGERSDIRA